MMKCQVVQNAGFLLILFFIAKVECSFFIGGSQTVQELCLSNHYIYSVEPNESRQLKLTSNQSSGEINKWHQKSKKRCRKEFKTNNAASHFLIILSNVTIPSCSEKCQCNYIEISEPGYTEKFCGVKNSELYFESKGDYLAIDIYLGPSMQFEVTLTFTVERNYYVLTGHPGKGVHPFGNILETPYFPNTYQSDYVAEYILQSHDENGRVMLMFLDFQIAEDSFIEVFGHNGTHPARVYGSTFRPPIFVSQTNQMSVRFEANNQPGRSGFKAACYYIEDIDLHSSVPYTKCGGLKRDYGGFLNIEAIENQKYYDCLWHVSPSSFLTHFDNYFLSVSLLSIKNMGMRANLEFREGLTSKSKLVKSISCNSTDCSKNVTEITVPAKSGIYIRFNGFLSSKSVVNMIYSTYYTGDCQNRDLMCNDRCLLPSLYCDGVPNCPDGSDERSCTTSTSTTELETSASDIVIKEIPMKRRVAIFVIIAIGVCGLVITCIVLIFIIYHFKKRMQFPEEGLAQSEITDQLSGSISREQSQRSLYDHLPSYEDFIKCSDHYPPLFFTRAAKRYSEPYMSHCNILHTTSFCGQDSSAPSDLDNKSFNSNNSSSNENPHPDEPSCSFERNSFRDSFKKGLSARTCGLRRTRSHDSKLNQVLESYHVHFSITHSIHPQSKYNSLPPNLKITNMKCNNVKVFLEGDISQVEGGLIKGSCLSFHDTVSVCSVTMADIKSRCHSDPCTRINVHYSLYH